MTRDDLNPAAVARFLQDAGTRLRLAAFAAHL
jgi:hypothetical protein